MRNLLAAGMYAALLVALPIRTAYADTWWNRHYVPTYVQEALDYASRAHRVNRTCLYNIASRESGFNPLIDNWQGSGAGGLMQFKDGTWRFMSYRAGFGGYSKYHAWAAAHTAAWAIANPGLSQGGLAHWGGYC